MGAVNFPNWADVLDRDGGLNQSEQVSYRITIRWFLSFCKRAGCAADFQQAHAFIDFARSEKQTNDWVVERWREAIRWFFRTASKHSHKTHACEATRSMVSATTSTIEKHIPKGPRGPEKTPASLLKAEPEWKLQCVRGVRIRNFSHSTEKSYLHWLRRFATYWQTQDLEALGETKLSYISIIWR